MGEGGWWRSVLRVAVLQRWIAHLWRWTPRTHCMPVVSATEGRGITMWRCASGVSATEWSKKRAVCAAPAAMLSRRWTSACGCSLVRSHWAFRCCYHCCAPLHGARGGSRPGSASSGRWCRCILMGPSSTAAVGTWTKFLSLIAAASATVEMIRFIFSPFDDGCLATVVRRTTRTAANQHVCRSPPLTSAYPYPIEGQRERRSTLWRSTGNRSNVPRSLHKGHSTA